MVERTLDQDASPVLKLFDVGWILLEQQHVDDVTS